MSFLALAAYVLFDSAKTLWLRERPERSLVGIVILTLSVVALFGVALNAFLGWWWADPIAAMVMVPIIVREGVEGLRGEACDDCGPEPRGDPSGVS